MTEPMPLGMDTVNWFLEQCPNLVILGNLRSWSRIDYYNPESQNYYRSESQLSKLKSEAVAKNWDIDFDLESLNYLNI